MPAVDRLRRLAGAMAYQQGWWVEVDSSGRTLASCASDWRHTTNECDQLQRGTVDLVTAGLPWMHLRATIMHMNGWTDTSLAIANMTDEGLFESLATDVLRHAVPAYGHLAHVGVNAAGKTRKAPVDALGFEPGASPPHLVVVHHTISATRGLAQKWLRDPAKVKKRKANSLDLPPGDVIKSIQVIKKERLRRPDLRATLVLTTNNEPDDAVVLDVQALCAAHGIDVDLWARTRITSVLDTTGTGQWIRKKYLGVPQQRLSAERLAELSATSLELARPVDEPAAWTRRHLDVELAAIQRPVTFLTSRSGSGKTVACYRLACDHLTAGGFALVLPAEVINEAATLEHALDAALRRLDPALASDESPLQWSSPAQPLLLIIEDINRSGQPVRLMEKIARWGLIAERAKSLPAWRLICPTWPQIIAAADHSIAKSVETMAQLAGGMTASEGTSAVALRAQAQGRALSLAQASAISGALGHDPLLIALYDFDEKPTSQTVIGQYVHRELRKLEQTSSAMAVEYLKALRTLALKMLGRLQLEPTISQVLEDCAGEHQAGLIRLLIAQGTVMYQQAGPDIDPVLRFRHDRVRDWLFVDALADADAREPLHPDVIEDPFLAEVVGEVLAVRNAPELMLSVAASVAPLSLFHALRSMPPDGKDARVRALAAINAWLDQEPNDGAGHENLLWECLSALARTDDPEVPALVRRIPYRHPTGLSAALRNGDVIAGAMLCEKYEPGMNTSFRDVQIAHVHHALGGAFVTSVGTALEASLGEPYHISGLLRLAGHIGCPSLGLAVRACWEGDAQRAERLADYLWALARCCEPATAELYLQPVIDMWALLSDETDAHGSSERNRLAVYNVDWAFARTPPIHAIAYLIKRAESDDLRWPIMFMLRGVRDERVLDMLKDELINRYRINPERAYFFRTAVFGHWDREVRLPESYRTKLAEIWSTAPEGDAVRRAAFDLWSMAIDSRDLDVLLNARLEPAWDDRILQKRLLCGDRSAVPALIAHLEAFSDFQPWWWQYAQDVPSTEILGCVERTLAWRRGNLERASKSDLDWHVAPILMGYPPESIESILVKHWDHVGDSPQFIQAALFAATNRTKQLAASAIQALPEPCEAFKYIATDFGIKRRHGVSVTRREQIEALAPYISLISEHDLERLAGQCNSVGWIDTRKRVFGDVLATLPSQWNSERACEMLDDIANRGHRWMRHEVDRILETGTSWPDLLSDLSRWLESRQSINVLSFVAEAIAYKGSRADLVALKPFPGMDGEQARQIIANTTFSVRRRIA